MLESCLTDTRFLQRVGNSGTFSTPCAFFSSRFNRFKHSLQVNHLSTALLSLLLLPRMARAAADGLSKPRLVIVSSEVHFWTKIPEIVTTTPHILQKMNEESYYKSMYVDRPASCSSVHLLYSGTTTRYYESKRKLTR